MTQNMQRSIDKRPEPGEKTYETTEYNRDFI